MSVASRVGEAAVGVEFAKDFGEDGGGGFQGVVGVVTKSKKELQLQGKRRVYPHIEYEYEDE